MRRIQSVMVGSALVVLAACGGGGTPAAQPSPSSPAPVATSPSPTETAQCSPSGTQLEVEAEGVHFDSSCLAAPADTAFTIEFRNKDGIQHNIVIEGGGDQFLNGDPVTSGKITYHVDPIAAGVYTFYCKFHPTEMQGQFVSA